ncbi:tRNA1(Val) (adenine(37)-N6)-methyltransferase [Ligilactobacillus ceti]|uniref:O-methyltransferase n=1 Tax=Ligilactobacillus ceti DSM 22408 TaxID=1122146 RepID=A0A0R2KM25_9LACO|nr:O-methyltransferase [Ligilactobacillus ceti DSM 22408]
MAINPPYFADQPTSEKNPNPYLAIARHEIKVNLAQIIEMSSALLKRGGKLAMIHRPERLIEIFAEMEKNHLVPKRVQLVYPKADKEANMVLVEAIRDGNPGGTRFLPPLTVYQANGEYTKEVHTIIYGE